MTTTHQKEQAERKSLAGSTGTTTFNTYRDRAEADLQLENQGRHSAAAKASVTGSARVPQVPRMPEGSPWAGDLVPPEEPTHYDINALEPNGTPAEIEASLRKRRHRWLVSRLMATWRRRGPLPRLAPRRRLRFPLPPQTPPTSSVARGSYEQRR
jgi:hypothetical protein